MNYKRFMSYAFLLICVLGFGVLFFQGCGASRQSVDGEDVNIDDLLGEESATTASQNSDQDEVLRLLGITPQETQPQETVAAPEESVQSTESDLTELQDELMEKDREISTLRSELTQKESKISELKSQIEAQRSAPVRPSGSISDASADFKARYQAALSLFNSRNYQQALASFQELLASDPNNSLSDNCQYWIGECYYALSNFNQAIAEFEKVFSFPNSNKSDDAQLKLGLCYMKLGEKQQARAEFDRLISTYPQSEYVALAQRYIARL